MRVPGMRAAPSMVAARRSNAFKRRSGEGADRRVPIVFFASGARAIGAFAALEGERATLVGRARSATGIAATFSARSVETEAGEFVGVRANSSFPRSFPRAESRADWSAKPSALASSRHAENSASRGASRLVFRVRSAADSMPFGEEYP
jgi:hypothetical protein